MNKREPENKANLFFDEDGANIVSEQIMDVYNSGVIDQSNANFDLDAGQEDAETK
ncbi:hypothetical protein J2Z40_001959 [Cytobacillus eiseniae]|uniref:DUF4025 domain-containing protein n=1 Tax=Cytobacillus eiseniae TaxID=762947 RepID=A0ABS4RER4_9BACI|nr:hypothetical protein [Cytobacillus eiseniae]MBP2241396.1 hypothetical protein [Cytobacillus eiseniae]